ncbi:zf-HC2 domain-containing protein [Nonomuraea glycinis]|uniref:RNA polymerase subunit sigma n=1 Tax=Nonomuraea glycinis TaxID=2047744 RepID=A0A918E932_9ACTN|nr:zf-HC2 domain-containing protein [Nonomuraea glycinis]MCA2182402.1 zf-HC2 domain-containing protein [Nonomuraea glycinis]GGP16112.1 RNA polymerase subunit sigma [Nonomuraea glycinis]
MNSRVEHTDVGAYALGLLDEDDRLAFEAHLLRCRSCEVELTELSGVAHALTGLGPVEDAPPLRGRRPPEVIDMLRRKQAADRRTRRSTFVIGVAASVTLVLGGLTIGAQFGGESTPPAAHTAQLGPAEQFYAMGTPLPGVGADGVSGGLVLESKGWGTHAAIQLSGVKGPLECELVAVGKNGERRVMMGWAVPSPGYGVPGSPDPLYMHGAAALPVEKIDHFEVLTTAGRKILTVEV